MIFISESETHNVKINLPGKENLSRKIYLLNFAIAKSNQHKLP